VAQILLLTEDLVAIHKPPGVSLATGRRHPQGPEERLLQTLPAEQRQALEGPLFLVHRLDVGTSGLVLLARHRQAHRALAQALALGQIHRTYLALAWGKVRPAQGQWAVPLGPDPRDRRKMRPSPSGKPALTVFCRLGFCRPVSLVQLEPKTGRTHQLRVHLAASGHPIVGDDLYGGPRHRGLRGSLRQLLQPPHLLLHAWRLVLPPAFGGFLLQAPLPPAFAHLLQVLGLSQCLPPLVGEGRAADPQSSPS